MLGQNVCTGAEEATLSACYTKYVKEMSISVKI